MDTATLVEISKLGNSQKLQKDVQHLNIRTESKNTALKTDLQNPEDSS